MTNALTKAGSRGLMGRTFEQHRDFHGTVVRAALGGGAGALLAHLISGGMDAASSFPLLVTLSAAGALCVIGAKGKAWLRGASGAALGLAGGLMHGHYAAQWPWFAALLLGAVAAPILARGESPAKMAITGVFTGALSFAGLYVASVLTRHGVLDAYVPGALASAVAGSAAGLFFGLGAAPKYIALAEDPVEAAYNVALKNHRGELYDILERSLGIYQSVCEDLKREQLMSSQLGLPADVSSMTIRVLDIADRVRVVEGDLGAAPVSDLEARITELKEKAEGTKDESARQTLGAAINSLEHQRESVESIARGRERVVARLHANVALLEKVRYSLVHLRSADAERAGSEETPLDEALDELSVALDATSDAVGEVYGTGTALPAPVDPTPSDDA